MYYFALYLYIYLCVSEAFSYIYKKPKKYKSYEQTGTCRANEQLYLNFNRKKMQYLRYIIKRRSTARYGMCSIVCMQTLPSPMQFRNEIIDFFLRVAVSVLSIHMSIRLCFFVSLFIRFNRSIYRYPVLNSAVNRIHIAHDARVQRLA